MKTLLMVALFVGVVWAGLGPAAIGGAAQGICPTSLPSFNGTITVFGGGTSNSVAVVISPTNISTTPPRGFTLCAPGGGYAQLYYTQEVCDVFNSQFQSPTPTADGCTYYFENYPTVTRFVVKLTCGNTSTLTINPTATVFRFSHPDTFVYIATGSISSVCPLSPPPPPPVPLSLSRLVCSDPLCSQNCTLHQLPQGQCVPAANGTDMMEIVTCASASTVTTQLFPQSTGCTGPAFVTTTPTGVCIHDQGRTGFVALSCSAIQPPPAGIPRLRRRLQHP